jgi:hexosaminidase
MNRQVVMTPTNFVYLDYYQGDPSLEPSTFARLLLSTCYRFEPTPEGVDPKYILGGQGNLWTESVPNPRHAEYMTWPRAFALAEVFWSPKASRNWDDFSRRVESQFQRLDAAQVNYARTMYDVALTPVRDAAGKPAVRMTTELSGCDIYYTFDGTNPDQFMPKYAGRAGDDSRRRLRGESHCLARRPSFRAGADAVRERSDRAPALTIVRRASRPGGRLRTRGSAPP